MIKYNNIFDNYDKIYLYYDYTLKYNINDKRPISKYL